MKSLCTSTAALLAALVVGCNDDTASTPQDDRRVLTLGFDALPSLGEGWVYEGWAVTAGEPRSTGRFSIDAAGRPTPREFVLDSAVIDDADLVVITIEPEM